jgi:putative mRNA 3-end processing factor
MGFSIPNLKTFPLDYYQTLDLDTKEYSKLTVYKADHIPGACQVVLELNHCRVGYTGDFRNPGIKTDILKDLDILLIDATYGDPSYIRESEENIMNAFVKLLRKLLVERPVVIYAYYGKINDVMAKLREWGIDIPFVLPQSQWNIYTVLQKYGYNVDNIFLEGSREAEEIKKSRWYIEFNLASKFIYLKRRNDLAHVLVTGRYGKTIARQGNSWIVGLSGHADFKELVYYVEEARPKLLIVDGYRSLYAHAFSSYVNQNLRIRSIVMPF